MLSVPYVRQKFASSAVSDIMESYPVKIIWTNYSSKAMVRKEMFLFAPCARHQLSGTKAAII